MTEEIKKGTWVEIHPETAAGLGIAEGDIVEVTSDTGSVEAPAYLHPGLRPDVVAMPMGQPSASSVRSSLPGEVCTIAGCPAET